MTITREYAKGLMNIQGTLGNVPDDMTNYTNFVNSVADISILPYFLDVFKVVNGDNNKSVARNSADYLSMIKLAEDRLAESANLNTTYVQAQAIEALSDTHPEIIDGAYHFNDAGSCKVFNINDRIHLPADGEYIAILQGGKGGQGGQGGQGGWATILPYSSRAEHRGGKGTTGGEGRDGKSSVLTHFYNSESLGGTGGTGGRGGREGSRETVSGYIGSNGIDGADGDTKLIYLNLSEPLDSTFYYGQGGTGGTGGSGGKGGTAGGGVARGSRVTSEGGFTSTQQAVVERIETQSALISSSQAFEGMSDAMLATLRKESDDYKGFAKYNSIIDAYNEKLADIESDETLEVTVGESIRNAWVSPIDVILALGNKEVMQEVISAFRSKEALLEALKPKSNPKFAEKLEQVSGALQETISKIQDLQQNEAEVQHNVQLEQSKREYLSGEIDRETYLTSVAYNVGEDAATKAEAELDAYDEQAEQIQETTVSVNQWAGNSISLGPGGMPKASGHQANIGGVGGNGGNGAVGGVGGQGGDGGDGTWTGSSLSASEHKTAGGNRGGTGGLGIVGGLGGWGGRGGHTHEGSGNSYNGGRGGNGGNGTIMFGNKGLGGFGAESRNSYAYTGSMGRDGIDGSIVAEVPNYNGYLLVYRII